jgi:type I restriction enzyme, S subunit
MSEWKPAKLGDIAEMCLGKMLDKEKNKGVLQPYLANLNVRWGGFDLSNLSTMRFENSESERYGLRSGDLVICEGGEPGRCAIWRDEVPEMKIQKAIHRLRTNKNYSNEFVYYQFLLAGRSGELAKHFNGSTIKHLTGYSLKQVEFKFPPLAEQKKIAAVLSTLDAKIALNHRINGELEGLAKLLYDYWFVQSDFPLSAAQAAALGKPKLVGQPYRTSGGKMLFNPTLKREIPVGWEVGTLSQIAKTGSGGTPLSKKPEYYDGGEITWINSGELNSPYIVSGCNFITQAGLDNSSAKLFPSRTLLIALYGATAGKVSLLLTEACLNQAVCGIIPNDPKSLFYLKFLLSDLYSHLVMMSTGSARDNLSQDLVRKIKVVIPPPDILKQFDEFVSASVATIANNILENQELTALRDWLLPMLMNGQVRVECPESRGIPQKGKPNK